MRITRSIVPNLFTLANAFMGFSAIVHTSNGEYLTAAIFILAAGIFDMLDGLMARLTNSASEFGVMLDSLCDAVSFGVAPSYMLYKMYFYSFGDIGILLASLPALAGVIRLARFNVQVSGFEDKSYFTGMPIPSGALIVVSYLVFYLQKNEIPEEYLPAMTIGVSVLTALAMVSHIKHDNVPRFTIRYVRQKPVVFVIFVIGILLCAVTKGKAIFPFMLFYFVVSAIRHFIYWIKESREATDEIDESEQDEPSPYYDD
jgi:CDP-diacylglycerol---serine O-phosphatidyltransferase